MVGWHHNLWETLKDREAWLAIIHGVRESDTAYRLNNNNVWPRCFLPHQEGASFPESFRVKGASSRTNSTAHREGRLEELKSPNGPTAKAEERKREGWSPSVQRPRGSWPGAHRHQHNSGLPGGLSAGLHCTAVVPSLKWFPIVRGT